MSTHLTDTLYSSFSQIHRAIVQYSSTTTGEIQVIIPSVTGNDTTVPISFFGREEHPFENDWVVPSIGDTIIVCREDEDYTNTFWINTTYNPVRADVGESNPSNYNFGPAGSVSAFDLIDFGSTPTSSGLYLGSVNMGYYNHTASEWRTYMDYNGNFYLRGSGTNALTWNGSTLAVTGTVTATDGEIGGWTIDADSLFSGTKDTSGYADGGGITISSGGSIHAKQFYIDTSGNAFFKGDLTGANITGTTGTFTGSITGASGTFTGSITGASGTFTGSITGASGTFGGALSGASISGGTISGTTLSGSTVSGNTITGGSITTGDITITGLGSAGIDIGGADATSWHMDADGNQWWGTSGTYNSAAYKIANWGGAYLLYARIGGADAEGSSQTGKAWEINAGNITNVSTHNSIVATDGIAIGLNSVYGIFRAAGGKIIARGYSGGDIRMGIAQTTTDQPEYDTVGDIVMSKESGNIRFSVEQALTVDNGVVTIASPSLTGNPTAPTQSSGNNSTRIATTAYADAAGGGVDWTADQGSTNIHSGNYTNTTYTSSDFNHDSLTGFVTNEHIDWSASQSANIHSNNYTNTTYSVGDGGLTTKDFTTTLKNKLDGIASSANNYTHPSLNHVPTGGSTGQFLEWTSSGLALWSNPPADATKLPLTGGTMSGGITFSGGNHITGSASSNVYFQGGSSGTSWLRAYSGSSAKIKCGSAGDIVFYASPRPSVSTGHDLGTSSLYWNYLYAKKIDYSAVGYAVSSGAYLALQSADDNIKLSGSSERIKKEIVPIPIADALTRIKALRPVDFSAKKNHSTLAIDNLWEYERFRGFIAEEVAAVSHQYGVYNWWESDDPESEDYDKPRSHISTVQTEWTDEDVAAYYDLAEAKPHMYSDQAILADAVAALQELSNKLDAAEARIAVLETA